jgi:Arylsulfotransferase (ASST)
VQEIDIRTGRVLFQWNSADHVPYSASETPLPASPSTPWDWFHVNAVHLDGQGNLLIDARDTWTTYDVSLRTGAINWQLGGKDSTFTEQAAPGQTLDSAGAIFAWQHDPEQVGPDTFTWFDDEAAPTELAYSRSVTVRLDFHNNTATVISSDNQPDGLSASAEGNAQTTLNGDQFIGWGTLPYISEFSPSGQLEFSAEFPAGVNTYRAYRLPWPGPSHGRPGPGGHRH